VTDLLTIGAQANLTNATGSSIDGASTSAALITPIEGQLKALGDWSATHTARLDGQEPNSKGRPGIQPSTATWSSATSSAFVEQGRLRRGKRGGVFEHTAP